MKLSISEGMEPFREFEEKKKFEEKLDDSTQMEPDIPET